MMNLNSEEFATKDIKVFNNGEAGRVKNVTISVEKRKMEEPDSYPIYKLIYTDPNGGSINAGVYYFTPNPQKNDEQNERSKKFYIQRLLTVAKCLVGNDFKFPEVSSMNDATDTIIKLINKEVKAGNNKVNLFAAYGTADYPKIYLTVRFFDFIEPVDTPDGITKLKPKKDDLMERPTDDNESSGSNDLLNTNSSTKTVEDDDFL